MGLIFTNMYFDSNDYVNPIKYYLDDRFYWPLLKSYIKITNLFVKKQQLQLQDNINGFIPVTINDYFFELDNYKDILEWGEAEGSGDLLQVFFRYDTEYQVYNRQVYSLA